MDGTRRRLAGRYELLEVIGRGGMGVVYRATDLVLGRSVAVKVLPAVLADGEPTRVARFEREARLAASLIHPGVVAVYDSGVDEATRFIVMECVTGRSLAAILRDHAPLEPAHAARIAERVADALVAAHAAGLVHRDVKPANVMVADDGQVKVLDFGIARAIDGTTLTHTASVLGSAGYMAPEQALGGRADERSDIYSLGCLLYAMLSGRPPFTGEVDAAVLHQHVNADPHPPSHTNARVSQALDALVMRMLAKSPDARPQSAAQVRGLLVATLTEPPATPAMSPTARTARMQETAVTSVLSAGVRVKRHPRATAAALAGLALLLALVVALSTDRGSPQRPGPPSRQRSLQPHRDPQVPARCRVPCVSAYHRNTHSGKCPGGQAHYRRGDRRPDLADRTGCRVRRHRSASRTPNHQQADRRPGLLRDGPNLRCPAQADRPHADAEQAHRSGTHHTSDRSRAQHTANQPQLGARQIPTSHALTTARPATRPGRQAIGAQPRASRASQEAQRPPRPRKLARTWRRPRGARVGNLSRRLPGEGWEPPSACDHIARTSRRRRPSIRKVQLGSASISVPGIALPRSPVPAHSHNAT